MNPTATAEKLTTPKPSILIFVEYYLPGYKSGGPVRSVANLVSLLAPAYTLFVVTRDRDHQDRTPYADITADTWITGADCQLMYLSPAKVNLRTIRRLIREVKAHYIYANSLLGPLTRRLLVLHILRRQRLVIAPRGELHAGALRLKAYKKLPFVYLVRAVSQNSIIWHATDIAEVQAIRQIFTTSKVQHVPVRFAPDTPRQLRPRLAHRKEAGRVNLVFMSRITAKKGLHYLLRILRQFPAAGQLNLTIYGPIGEPGYWQSCQSVMDKLPGNCTVSYKGTLPHERVSRELAGYDFFVLPTLGENFGHAIFEALSVGLPVLLSDQTPWRQLTQHNAGWDVPLHDQAAWLTALQESVAMTNQRYRSMTAAARHLAEAYMDSVPFQQSYSDLFSIA